MSESSDVYTKIKKALRYLTRNTLVKITADILAVKYAVNLRFVYIAVRQWIIHAG